MKLKKADLIAALEEDPAAPYPMVHKEHVGPSRWGSDYVMVVKVGEKFFRAGFTEGAGDEGERPFEHAPAEVECREVAQVRRLAYSYEPVPLENALPGCFSNEEVASSLATRFNEKCGHVLGLGEVAALAQKVLEVLRAKDTAHSVGVAVKQ